MRISDSLTIHQLYITVYINVAHYYSERIMYRTYNFQLLGAAQQQQQTKTEVSLLLAKIMTYMHVSKLV